MAMISSESHDDQIARVRQMAVDGVGESWDLSANDLAALKTVLAERDELLAELTEAGEVIHGEFCITQHSRHCQRITNVIAKVEGR